MIDFENDYSGTWIDLMAEVKMLHNYCLKGEWSTAEQCAKKCGEYSTKLAIVLKEMSEVK